MSLSSAERGHLLADLDHIAGLVHRIEEQLEVAAARSRTSPSAWTEARLDKLRGAAFDLWEKVNTAPIDVD